MTLRLADVSYRYAGADLAVLEHIDLELSVGEVVGIVGANESGKSTLALVASGLAPRAIGGALGGRVTIDDLDTTEAPSYALAQRCGVLFQNAETQLSGTARSVWEEIAFGPRNLALPLADVVERVNTAIASLGIQGLASRDPTRLSGGQAQLVALASVLALRPSYLVLDEPTSQLDPAGTRLVGDALGRVAGSGTGVLLIEHKTDLVASLATRVAVLVRGRIARQGPTADVLGDDAIEREGVRAPQAVALRRAVSNAGKQIDARLSQALPEAAG